MDVGTTARHVGGSGIEVVLGFVEGRTREGSGKNNGDSQSDCVVPEIPRGAAERAAYVCIHVVVGGRRTRRGRSDRACGSSVAQSRGWPERVQCSGG